MLTGTTRLRSHVDVDTVGGLVPLDGVLAAAQDCADIAEVQVIAFPQEGLLRDPGAADLMAEAMERGATVVGGMPHWEATEDEQREHVRICFELAARYDADVDMHVDETDDGSVRTLAMVLDETERRGWQHRVTVGHVCALSAADDEYADRVIADCARLGVTVVANPVTNLVLQGRGDRGLVRRGTTRIRELLAAGCRRGLRPGLRAGRLLSLRPRRPARGRADLGARRAPHDRRASSTRRWPRSPPRRPPPGTWVAVRRRGRGPRRPPALRSRQLAGGLAAAGPAAPGLVPRPHGGAHDGHPRAAAMNP